MIALLGLAAGGTMAAITSQAITRVNSAVTDPPPYTVDGPLVSVITIALNEEDRISDLLNAIHNQTYQNIEIILVDDESTDRTVSIAESFGVKVLTKTYPICNYGMSRNIGAAVASGDILIFSDADSVPEHTLVEKTVESINNGADVVWSNHILHDRGLIPTNLLRVFRGWFATPPETCNAQFTAVTREAYDILGGYDEWDAGPDAIYSHEDTYFGQRAVEILGLDRVQIMRNHYSGTSGRVHDKHKGF